MSKYRKPSAFRSQYEIRGRTPICSVLLHLHAQANFFLAALVAVAAGATATLAAPGLGRSAAKNSAVGRVLMMSFFSSQPRRAVITPYFIILKCVDECASVEITTFTPRSLHIRK